MLINLLIERLQTFAALHSTKDITDSELVALVTENMDVSFLLNTPIRGIFATNSFTKSTNPDVPPTFIKESYIPFSFIDKNSKPWIHIKTQQAKISMQSEQTWIDGTFQFSLLQMNAQKSILKCDSSFGGVQQLTLANNTPEFYEEVRKNLMPIASLSDFNRPCMTIINADADINIRKIVGSSIRIEDATIRSLNLFNFKTRTYDVRDIKPEASSNKYKPYVNILMDRFVLSDGTNLPFIKLDGIDSGILQEHTLGNTTVRRVLTKDLEEHYTVTAGTINAHGYTLEDAQRSLRRKIEVELAGFNFDIAVKLLNSGTITVADYRALTGACEAGVTDFRKRHNITTTEMTLAEVNDILTINDYGYSKFHNLYALYDPKVNDWTVEKIRNKFI